MAKKRTPKKPPSNYALKFIRSIDRQRTEWFDPVLFFVNGQTDDDYEPALFNFRLPGISGQWSCDIRNPAELAAPYSPLRIRNILFALIENDGVTKKIWDELSELVSKVELKGSTCLAWEPREFLTTGDATIETLDQWLSLLIAELIYMGLDDRVRTCALHRCDNFFVNWKTRGPSQIYCCSNHSSQARVERKRKKDRRNA